MTDELPNSVEVRAPELDDYLSLLAALERLEARVAELEKRLLDRTDSPLQ